MTGSPPEATPHLVRAREHLAALLGELREARLAGEGNPIQLAYYANVARGLDTALEEEIR